jgi:EamA domain-containing membrane protein RarD
MKKEKAKMSKKTWGLILAFLGSLILGVLPCFILYLNLGPASPVLGSEERNLFLTVLLLISLYPLPFGYSLLHEKKKIYLVLMIVLEAIDLGGGILCFIYLIGKWTSNTAYILMLVFLIYSSLILALLPLDIYKRLTDSDEKKD